MFIDLFRRFGCNYLNMNGLPENYTMPPEQPLFWPANFGVGVNPCVANGYYYPVKPMSYFCPVACGCRAGDLHCPDTCPARIAGANVSQGPGPEPEAARDHAPRGARFELRW